MIERSKLYWFTPDNQRVIYRPRDGRIQINNGKWNKVTSINPAVTRLRIYNNTVSYLSRGKCLKVGFGPHWGGVFGFVAAYYRLYRDQIDLQNRLWIDALRRNLS